MNPNASHSARLVAADVALTEHNGGGAFYIEREGRRLAEMTFVLDGPTRALFDHTFVASELRGRGVAALLMRAAVEWARRTGVRVVPQCSYVRTAFARDPKIRDVLA